MEQNKIFVVGQQSKQSIAMTNKFLERTIKKLTKALRESRLLFEINVDNGVDYTREKGQYGDAIEGEFQNENTDKLRDSLKKMLLDYIRDGVSIELKVDRGNDN